MTHRERFYATIERKPVDYPASWLGMPNQQALENLFSYFQVATVAELKQKIGDDLFPVEVPYHSSTTDAFHMAFDFTRRGRSIETKRSLSGRGFFHDCSDPRGIEEFDWPDPSRCIDPEECRARVDRLPSDYARLGVVWAAHFQDACAAFGMETALIKMIIEPDMFRAVIDRITEFYLQACDVFYAATKGRLDAVLLGNDFGSQEGEMLSLDLLERHVFPGAKALIDQAKSYGLKVFYHSCGSIYNVIPGLIDLGADVIHPIQAKARKMGPELLKESFGDRVSFCGGVDHQELLIHGTPREVSDRVRQLRRLFPTGLILSPSHEAILPEIAPANIEALFDAVHS